MATLTKVHTLATDQGATWANLENLAAQDGNVATTTINSSNVYLTGYDFNLQEGDVPNTLTVHFWARKTAMVITAMSILLIVNDEVQETSYGGILDTEMTEFSREIDLTETPLSVAEINTIGLSMSIFKTFGSVSGEVDYLELILDYTDNTPDPEPETPIMTTSNSSAIIPEQWAGQKPTYKANY